MRTLVKEHVTQVHHWSDSLFSFKTTRKPSFKFENGQFVMLGLEVDGKPLLRAYSIASANWEEELEFFSIKVPDGKLTSKLQNINIGQEIMISTRPTGTLVPGHLLPGRRLFLLATGTGLAPFLGIIKDPDIYQNFEQIILVHGARYISELAYQKQLLDELPKHEYLGEFFQKQFTYFPCVTRETFHFSTKEGQRPIKHNGRITDMMTSGAMYRKLDIEYPTTENDRFMICGNLSMLDDFCNILDERGYRKASQSKQGHYVIETAFVEK